MPEVCALLNRFRTAPIKTELVELEETFSRKPLLLIRRSTSSLSGWSENCEL